MISDIDLRDWDYDKLHNSVTLISTGAPKYPEAIDADNYLREFIEHIETISKQGRKQVAALFKPVKTAP